MRPLAVLALLCCAGPARADQHGVTIVNGGGATIREIHIGAAGAGLGPNRLRSTLPPRATAEIAYSTGCRVDIDLVFDGGRSERFADQDVCAGLRIDAGQGVGRAPATKRPAASPGYLLPHVDVPWTGRSITKKFGRME